MAVVFGKIVKFTLDKVTFYAPFFDKRIKHRISLDQFDINNIATVFNLFVEQNNESSYPSIFATAKKINRAINCINRIRRNKYD